MSATRQGIQRLLVLRAQKNQRAGLVVSRIFRKLPFGRRRHDGLDLVLGLRRLDLEESYPRAEAKREWVFLLVGAADSL